MSNTNQNTTLETFAELVKNEIAKRLPDYNVRIRDCQKNNGVILKGILIQNDSALVPQIYLERYYQQYQNGRPLDSICDAIIKVSQKEKPRTVLGMEIEKLTEFDSIKDKIYLRIINYEKNKALLEDMPHQTFLDLDLAVIYVIQINLEDIKCDIKVTKDLFKTWGIPEDNLYEIAFQNTKKYNEWSTVTMKSMLLETLKEDGADNDLIEYLETTFDTTFESNIHVIKSKQKTFGATALLYPDIIRDVSKQFNNGNFYILPSSVHEVFVLAEAEAEAKGLKKEDMVQMVREINDKEVDPKEILSDNIYYYDAKTDELSLCQA